MAPVLTITLARCAASTGDRYRDLDTINPFALFSDTTGDAKNWRGYTDALMLMSALQYAITADLVRSAPEHVMIDAFLHVALDRWISLDTTDASAPFLHTTGPRDRTVARAYTTANARDVITVR